MFAYQYTLGPQTVGWLVTLYFGSIWLTYVYNTTHGSLAATATWHATFNLVSIGGGAVSEAIPLTISLTIVLAAIVVARRYGSTDLAPHTRQTTPPAVPTRPRPSS